MLPVIKNIQHITDFQTWLDSQVGDEASPIFPSSEQNFSAHAECKEIPYYRDFKSASKQRNLFSRNNKDLPLKGFNDNKEVFSTLLGGNAKISHKSVPKNELLSFNWHFNIFIK